MGTLAWIAGQVRRKKLPDIDNLQKANRCSRYAEILKVSFLYLCSLKPMKLSKNETFYFPEND